MRRKIEIIAKDKTLDMGYDEFILSCKARNLRPATIKFYDNSILSIYKFIPPKTSIKAINHNTVDNFVIHCKNDLNIKDITINTYLRALKTILLYFMKMGYMDKFHISLIKYDKEIIQTYTQSEVKILLRKPDLNKSSFIEYRNWVICNLLYSCACRCSNIINLKINDIDLDNELIYFRTTKNRKPLVVPVSNSLKPILTEYINIRNGNEDDYLFCTAYGNKINRNTLSANLRKYNRDRGITTTGIHRWRHSFSKDWILNHGDVFKLQKILNHHDLDMVRNYVNMFTSDLQKDFEEFNPLDNLNKHKTMNKNLKK